MRPEERPWPETYRWDRIECHMREAIGSLESLRRFVIAKRDGRKSERKMTEGQFAVAYAHAYHHLNFAWNTRMMSEAAAEANFELHEKWPLEFDRYERKGDDDLPPVIPFEPRKEEFRPVGLGDVSEEGSDQMRLPVLLGLSAEGTPLSVDLATLPHMIVAGAAGQGKTMFMNTMIYRFITRYTPDSVKFVLCDPKLVEYTALADSPYLALPIVHETNQFVFALKWVDKEVARRLKLFSRAGCRNIQDYNGRTESDTAEGRETVPYLVVVADEIADYMARDRKRIEPLVLRVSAKARAAGIHLVIATQRPDRGSVTGGIKANIPGRIAFKMVQAADSRHIIGKNGAENLNGRGDMLFLGKDGVSIRRAQGAYVSDEKLAGACEAAVAKYGQARYLVRLPKGRPDCSIFDS